MSKQSIPLTAAAYAKNQAELVALQKERAEVMERLKTAREQGDLSENGAYKYAKFELGRINRRLGYLQKLLSQSYVAKADDSLVVGFGKTVTLLKKGDNEKPQTFTLVSEHESDPFTHKLSLISPLGQALIGKKAGDVFTIETPKGKFEWEVVSVN